MESDTRTYEGDWDSLPDFRNLRPVKDGDLPGFDLSPSNQPEYFALQYQGYIDVPRDGVYAFFTDSDDGSRLLIDDNLIVDNDGLHSRKEVRGVVALASGLHKICVQYFQKGGGREFVVSFEGPEIEKQVIREAVLFHQKKEN